MLRVRNESRWIAESIAAILPVCDRVFVFDDHSTDNTVAICRSLGDAVEVIESPFKGFNESLDKNDLLRRIYEHIGYSFEYIGQEGEVELTSGRSVLNKPSADDVGDVYRIGFKPGVIGGHGAPYWALCIDADEVLEERGAEKIKAAIEGRTHHAYRIRIPYLWDSPDRVRVDRVYSTFANQGRPSLFRMVNPVFQFKNTGIGGNGNLHCSSIPQEMLHHAGQCDAILVHWGYIDRATRIAKYRWYAVEKDPGNAGEDFYRHVVQGDISEVPADAVLMHAGPMEFVPLNQVLAG